MLNADYYAITTHGRYAVCDGVLDLSSHDLGSRITAGLVNVTSSRRRRTPFPTPGCLRPDSNRPSPRESSALNTSLLRCPQKQWGHVLFRAWTFVSLNIWWRVWTENNNMTESMFLFLFFVVSFCFVMKIGCGHFKYCWYQEQDVEPGSCLLQISKLFLT